ncbi:hypothetical protein N7E81_06305 [Reichenbachiella carrageenanivorans]|uniref:Dolichyl-phosphate-mannose-protein mannosyltransferase n=1 Tax=Reichenbachiella carrageenanivorans TaxID=2979869 RepID=A0ABY6D471_9BACT|nr:hypothetical protein [Reichenbachiella carrageenanivorans]UXX80709.1 hypothetical protein N7E81_06305 [Reichenbachiella carrageenanivorans]
MAIALIYIFNSILLIGFSYWHFLSYDQSPIRSHFWPAWLFKICSGLFLGGLFYGYYQSGDTIHFYEQASRLAQLDPVAFFEAITQGTVPSQSVRAIYFVRIVAVVKWLTHADYWLLSVYFSFASFCGATLLVDQLVRWRADLKIPAIVAFLYFPSIVFWSSGLLKESLAFAAVSVLIGCFLAWQQTKKFSFGSFLLSVLALAIIVWIKYYVAAVLIPLLIYLVLYHIPFGKKWIEFSLWQRTGILTLALVLPVLGFLQWLSPNLSMSRLWLVMQENHEAYIQLAPHGAVYTLSWFDNGWDLFVNMPYLWFSGLFRPVLGEDFSFPAVLASLENLALLIGAVLALLMVAKKKKMPWTAERLATVIYVTVLAIFLSYSAPNLGTLARFKIYYAPFVVLWIVYQLQSFKLFRKD